MLSETNKGKNNFKYYKLHKTSEMTITTITITVECHRGRTAKFERPEKHNDTACAAVLKPWGFRIGSNEKNCPLCSAVGPIKVTTHGDLIKIAHK